MVADLPYTPHQRVDHQGVVGDAAVAVVERRERPGLAPVLVVRTDDSFDRTAVPLRDLVGRPPLGGSAGASPTAPPAKQPLARSPKLAHRAGLPARRAFDVGHLCMSTPAGDFRPHRRRHGHHRQAREKRAPVYSACVRTRGDGPLDGFVTRPSGGARGPARGAPAWWRRTGSPSASTETPGGRACDDARRAMPSVRPRCHGGPGGSVRRRTTTPCRPEARPGTRRVPRHAAHRSPERGSPECGRYTAPSALTPDGRCGTAPVSTVADSRRRSRRAMPSPRAQLPRGPPAAEQSPDPRR